jgi:hypothetical protein
MSAPTVNPPETLARIDSRCKGCTNPIRAGKDYIAKAVGAGWMHVQCRARYCRILAEHEEGPR